jgi:uncharacterized protein (TIGR03437 family)
MPVPVRLSLLISYVVHGNLRIFMNIANPVSASFGDFPVKNAFRLSFFALMFACLCAGSVAFAQTPTPTATASPTPDPFVTQISSSASNTFVGGISGNGRFVVFESSGDLATLLPTETATTRGVTNEDGNREIFLYDYAQRRIFQITNTKVARVNANNPTVTVNATTGAIDFSNIEVEVSNNRPVISRDGRWIVFSSNAPTPFLYDGDATVNGVTNKSVLKADGNQEIFLYRIPEVATADLRSGANIEFVNLSGNNFTRVTDTPASRLPSAGTAPVAATGTPSAPPFVADDNRMAQINDRGSRIVFVSTRNLAAKNTDFNPEIFVWTRVQSPTLPATGSFAQVTNTTGLFTFNDNPSISGDTATDTGDEDPRSVIAFLSNASVMRDLNDVTIPTNNAETSPNAEIFFVNFNGAVATGLTQATRTQRATSADIVNILNPGPRLSRDGKLIAFESVATNPKGNTTTNETKRGIFIYEIVSDTFLQIGPRASVPDNEEDVLRFPVFTGDSKQLVFGSALNFTPGGTRVAQNDTTGLNPSNFNEIFVVPVPAPFATATAQSFTRLSNTRRGGATQVFVSDKTERLAFSFAAELGGGNADGTFEAFYLNVPPAPLAGDTTAATSALAFFTGATQREVVTPPATPTPTPSPVPSATPITALAPGMIGIVRKTAASGSFTLAASEATAGGASESQRKPPLPVELAGVTLSVNNAAAGLYFVSPTEIQFVVPIGLAPLTGTTTYPVVININDGSAVRTVRSALQIVAAQPDIYSSTNGPGGRARIFNSTNPLNATGTEPFTVTTTYVNGDGQNVTAPTKLRLVLTGVRTIIPRTAFTIRLVKADGTTTDIVSTGDQIPTDPMVIDGMPGAYTLDFILPASVAGAGDVSVIVIVNAGGLTFTSRPVDTAPKFRIN